MSDVPSYPTVGQLPAGEAPRTPVPSPVPLADIPGWFPSTGRRLFAWFLDSRTDRGIRGDLAEPGAYAGESAIVIGGHLRPGQHQIAGVAARPGTIGAAGRGAHGLRRIVVEPIPPVPTRARRMVPRPRSGQSAS